MSCKIKMGGYSFDEGVTFPWRRGLPPPWRGEKGRGWPHPSWVAAPSLLYICWTYSSSPNTHLVASIPHLVAPHHGCCLSEALPKLLATNTWRSGGGGVPADPFFRCPAGPRAWRSRRRAVRVTEHGGAATCSAGYTILRSSSEPRRRLRQVNDYVHYVRLC